MELIPLDDRYVSHQQITLLPPRSRERDPNRDSFRSTLTISKGHALMAKPRFRCNNAAIRQETDMKLTPATRAAPRRLRQFANAPGDSASSLPAPKS